MAEILQYKCPRCGRPLEKFKELGKYAAACSNGSCSLAYDYELFDTEEELFEALEKAARNLV